MDAGLEQARPGCLPDAGTGLGPLGPRQPGLDGGEQLLRSHRLDQVVVTADPSPLHPLAARQIPGQKDDR